MRKQRFMDQSMLSCSCCVENFRLCGITAKKERRDILRISGVHIVRQNGNILRAGRRLNDS